MSSLAGVGTALADCRYKPRIDRKAVALSAALTESETRLFLKILFHCGNS